MSDPYQVAGDIRRALHDISDHYDAALIPAQRATLKPTPPASNGAPKMKPATTPYRHSPAPASIPVLDARLAAHKDLVYYAQVVLMECRTIDDGAITRNVNGASPHGLCTFLNTWALMLAEGNPLEAAKAAQDLAEHGRTLRGYAYPNRPALVMGPCPLTPCEGTIRYDSDTEDAWCTQCGKRGDVKWWGPQMLPTDGGEVLVTAVQLIRILALEGHIVSHELIRQWASRGKLPRAGRDQQRRILYDRHVALAVVKDRKSA